MSLCPGVTKLIIELGKGVTFDAGAVIDVVKGVTFDAGGVIDVGKGAIVDTGASRTSFASPIEPLLLDAMEASSDVWSPMMCVSLSWYAVSFTCIIAHDS